MRQMGFDQGTSHQFLHDYLSMKFRRIGKQFKIINMAIYCTKANTFLGQFTSASGVITIEEATSTISLAKSLAFCLDFFIFSFSLSFLLCATIATRSTFLYLPIGLGSTIPFLLQWFLKFAMKLKTCSLIVGMDLLVKQIAKRTQWTHTHTVQNLTNSMKNW